MSSPESQSSPEGSPKGPPLRRVKYSSQPSSQLGVASTSRQTPTQSPKSIQGEVEEMEQGETGSEFASGSKAGFEFPLDVLKCYSGPNYVELSNKGINVNDCEAAFRNGTEPYVFIESIGEGAYASVYKAVKYQNMNTPLSHEVAIKVTKLEPFEGDEELNTELEILLKLMERPHINVLTCNEFFQNDPDTTQVVAHYIVFELAPLGDLHQVLCQRNPQDVEIWEPIKPQYCRYIIRGIARGVRHLFSLGISHGDVKAENVLIFWADRPAETNELGDDHPVNQSLRYNRMVPKLTDFNNSEQCEPGGPIMCIESKCAAYTAAPESWFFGDTPYDGKKADVYSVGALLLSTLLGCHPFSVPPNCLPHQQHIEMNNMKKSNLVKQLVRPFDTRLKQLLLKTLEPLPQNRITIEEFLSDDWFTQRMESQEREERWESTLWRGLPQQRSARRGRLKSY